MTFSLLARDPDSGALGGVAATGSLCVGGWVLRGRLGAGMSASQGAAPSVFWGEDVLDRMAAGLDAKAAVAEIVGADAGRAYRQLSALSADGGSGVFTGDRNTAFAGASSFDGGVVAGNLLAQEAVIDAARDGYLAGQGAFGDRLIAALRAGEAAGSDSRGLLSAALLVLHPDAAPLTLRIDHHATDPIGALAKLYERATTGDYADWASQVPTLSDPERVLD